MDLWSLDFCLACDRQTDGQVYCSESCRLAEYEKASSNPSSTASSPRSPTGMACWPLPIARSPFFLEPAYNFDRIRSDRSTRSPSSSSAAVSSFSTPAAAAAIRPRLPPLRVPRQMLSPSTSYSSLRSLHSQTGPTLIDPPPQLSDESKKALRAYAGAFDRSRNTRRQSSQ